MLLKTWRTFIDSVQRRSLKNGNFRLLRAAFGERRYVPSAFAKINAGTEGDQQLRTEAEHHLNESGSDPVSEQTVTLQFKIDKNRFMPLYAKPGQNLLDVARFNKLNVDGSCAGNLTCSTCHCTIDANVYRNLPQKSQEEEDILFSVRDTAQTSRLGCQVIVDESMEGMQISFPGMMNIMASSTTHLPRKVPCKQPPINPKKYKLYTKSAIPAIFEKYASRKTDLSNHLDTTLALANILPFRTNNYVIEELIDWSNAPADPMFQLNFPQPGMLPDSTEMRNVFEVQRAGGSSLSIRRAADVLRASLNPHPAKQQDMNVPRVIQGEKSKEEVADGIQHKYRETVLFFPFDAQYCHSYCTYCFRWAQFVGSENVFASSDIDMLSAYLRKSPNVSDLLLTGGDPMVLNSKQLGRYLDAITSDPTLDHVQTIRLGSKSLAYWPYKYVTDDDADDILRLFERTVNSGKHVALMAHFTHPVELSTPVVQEAIRRIRDTGVQIRCQAPLTDHINNDPDIWVAMWREQVRLGLVPYYMFMERDTGAKQWFGVPIVRALEVYNRSVQQLSGLAKTARGPCMSCTPGKVHVLGVENIAGEKVFVLKFLQSRNPSWTNRVFFAKYDEKALWLDDLQPAFNDVKFFFEDELEQMWLSSLAGNGVSGQMYQETPMKLS